MKYTIKILYDKPIIRIYNCQEFKFRNPTKNFNIKNLTINIRLFYNIDKIINCVNRIIIANYYLNFLKETKHV